MAFLELASVASAILVGLSKFNPLIRNGMEFTPCLCYLAIYMYQEQKALTYQPKPLQIHQKVHHIPEEFTAGSSTHIHFWDLVTICAAIKLIEAWWHSTSAIPFLHICIGFFNHFITLSEILSLLTTLTPRLGKGSFSSAVSFPSTLNELFAGSGK